MSKISAAKASKDKEPIVYVFEKSPLGKEFDDFVHSSPAEMGRESNLCKYFSNILSFWEQQNRLEICLFFIA